MPPENSKRFYYPELDGLRFIAFLLVFIHNANPILQGTFLEKFSEYSWFGVDLFFCLSGFLITKLLVIEYEQTSKINIRNFYIRRILRIWPLYFFYLIIGTIIIAPVEGRNINIPGHLAGLATFTFNFVYFSLLPSPILLFVHLWSISYEEQFYAVIPWLTRRLANSMLSLKVKWLLLLFITGTIIRGLFIYLNLDPASIYLLPITHFDSMICGVALGFGLFDQLAKKIHKAVLLTISAICFLGIFFLPNNNVNSWGLMLTYPLLGITTTLLVQLGTQKEEWGLKKFLGNNIFVYLGKISYGLYVFHFGTFTLTVVLISYFLNIQQPSFPQFTFPTLVIAFLLTVLFSVISYNLLEKPALKIKSRFSSVLSHQI